MKIADASVYGDFLEVLRGDHFFLRARAQKSRWVKNQNPKKSKKGASVPSVLIPVSDELSETRISARLRDGTKNAMKSREDEWTTNEGR